MPRVTKKSAGPVHGTALIERCRRMSRNSRQRCRRSESDDGSRKRRRELSMSDVGKKVNKGNTRRAWYIIEEFRRVIAFGSEGDSLNPISFYLPRIFPAWFFHFFFRGEIIINSLGKKKKSPTLGIASFMKLNLASIDRLRRDISRRKFSSR